MLSPDSELVFWGNLVGSLFFGAILVKCERQYLSTIYL